jgi:hypothetical protein
MTKALPATQGGREKERGRGKREKWEMESGGRREVKGREKWEPERERGGR